MPTARDAHELLTRGPLAKIHLVEIATRRPGLELRSFVPADAKSFADLMRANAEHLTRHGDYEDMVHASDTDVADAFAADDPLHNFGIYEAGALVGSVALVLGEPPKYGLGYLLAGVTHSNVKSVAVLLRVGFVLAEKFDAYDRYHLDLT